MQFPTLGSLAFAPPTVERHPVDAVLDAAPFAVSAGVAGGDDEQAFVDAIHDLHEGLASIDGAERVCFAPVLDVVAARARLKALGCAVAPSTPLTGPGFVFVRIRRARGLWS